MAEIQHTLSSGKLSVRISEKGAELTSIRDAGGLEYLWQAGEPWKRHAPVLFPIVGKLKGDIYFLNGREHHLSQHGFARDRSFTLVTRNDRAAEFRLTADEASKKLYPFDFDLRIKYEVADNILRTSYEVRNPGKNLLYFSIGAHPAFRCPLLPTEQFEDYYILFEQRTFLQTILHQGLRSKEQRVLPLDGKRLKLTTTIFDQDALVFENGQVNEVSLISEKSGRGVKMSCGKWPYFGIWSKKGCREFVCLEPWFGVADAVDTTKELKEKEGVISLESGGTFRCDFDVAVL